MAGPGDYAERATLAQDPTFIGRVVMAGTKKALTVQTEAGNGTIHDKRVLLASEVIEAAGQVEWRTLRFPAVVRRLAVGVASSFTVPGENPVNEADLDTVITRIWNAEAGVNSADT